MTNTNTMLKERLVFDSNGDDSIESRNLLGGKSTGIANLNSVKYKWTSSLYKVMLNNFWIPEKISLVEDRNTIKELTSDELEAFKNTLSFLIALDSMQCANLPRMSSYITAPEVSAIYTIQEFQEIEWGKAIYGDKILGISEKSTEDYLKYLANQRSKLIGTGVLYKGYNTNPYDYLNGAKRENFFETKVVEYSQSTAVEGWDDF